MRRRPLAGSLALDLAEIGNLFSTTRTATTMMNLLISTPAFLFALGVIIFVHEGGHLLAARAFDVRVLTFSLGFGKRIWGFKRGDTDYRVSLIPLGGYVKMSGELPEEMTDDPRDFLARPRWQRIIVYLAGPAMNVVLSTFLFWIVFMVGIDIPNARKLPPVVGAVAEGSRAEAAGFEMGDRIVAIDGEEVRNWEQVHLATLASPEHPLDVEYERAGVRAKVILTPERFGREEFGVAGFQPPGRVQLKEVRSGQRADQAGLEPEDEISALDGRPVATQEELVAYIQDHAEQPIVLSLIRSDRPIDITVTPAGEPGAGLIGVIIGYSYKQKYGPRKALSEAIYYHGDILRNIKVLMGKIFERRLPAKSAFSGPIEIFVMSGDQARRGFHYLLHLMGYLSFSIALLNLLPIPILDGGQIAILSVESVIRRDLPLMLKERLSQAGVLVIFALMLTVIVFDIQKRLPPGFLPGE